MMNMQEQKNARREEQYESIFKSQKASYLMLKKYFEEIEDKLNYLEAASKVPTEEIVNAQKGIAKVIINRSHENTNALMSSYEQVMDELSQFHNQVATITENMDHNREAILSEQKNSEVSGEKTLQVKMQDMIVAMKDMELRLNNELIQVQKSVAQAQVMQTPIIQTPIAQSPVMQTPPSVQMSVMQEDLSKPELTAEEIPESILEPEAESEPELIPEPEAELEPELIPEPEAESEPELIPEPEAEPEPEPIPEPIVEEAAEEEKPPMPDLSDPNKALNADEIASLFANMAEDVAKPEEAAEPEPEPIPEPIVEEAAEEEKPPMPDLSDPNKALSADEIAALFANMGA
jgi:microcompartment protein CcmL/EutN